MKKNTWKKPVAAALTMALALSGLAINGESKVTAAKENATFVLAEDAASGTSATPTQMPATGSSVTPVTTGSAVTPVISPALPVASGPAAKLVEDIIAADSYMRALKDNQKLLVQKSILTTADNQEVIFAQTALRKKNKNIKIGQLDLDGDDVSELFALYPNKDIEIYAHELEMLNNDLYHVKPIMNLKKVKELRAKEGKSSFTIKQGSKKKTTYTVLKYTWPKLKKKATYTVKGKKIKKGKKKLSKKAFKKFLKSYKKMTKVSFAKPASGVNPALDPTDYLYASSTQYVLAKNPGNVAPGEFIPDTLIIRYDAGDAYPYKAFGDSNGAVRYLLGRDLEADWKGLRDEKMTLANICDLMDLVYKGADILVTEGTPEAGTNYKVYNVAFDYGDGTEGDTSYKITVDESGVAPRFISVVETMSIGVISERYDFYYGDKAEYDGQMYDPLLSKEAYGDEEYAKTVGYKVRTLTVNIEGTKRVNKALNSVRFIPYSKTGKFSAVVEGKEIADVSTLQPESHEHYMFEQMINPDTGDFGYGEPTGELTWTAKS